MVLEEQRGLHEDLERLEQAIADRVIDDPKNVSPSSARVPKTYTGQIRERLNRDHQVASFLDRIHDQSQRLLAIYKDSDGSLASEVQKLSTGDPFEAFYREYHEIKSFHQRYPNEPVENLERAYKRRRVLADRTASPSRWRPDTMFYGRGGGNGRFFDLTQPHDRFVLTLLCARDAPSDLPAVPRRLRRLRAPPACPVKRGRQDDGRVLLLPRHTSLSTSEGLPAPASGPLDDLDRLLATFDADFEKAWEAGEAVGWEKQMTAGPVDPTREGDSDLRATTASASSRARARTSTTSRRRSTSRAAQARKARGDGSGENGSNPAANGVPNSTGVARAPRHKEGAIAGRAQRVARPAAARPPARADTRVNVERRQGMTEREREQELAALLAADDEARADAAALAADDGGAGAGADEDEDPDATIYNPLKLPLGWDGKPIPFWLYKLHGLGVELPCEVCGNFVYMGRRAFDKHFNEPRHVHGLRCLGITGNTALFRDITGINDALKLWDKMSRDKKQEKSSVEGVVQMEDGEGNVMPEKVYNDLRKQGLL